MRRAIAVLIAMGAASVAHAQSAIDQLQPLIDLSARRLAIAQQVALAKWENHEAVEDPMRESHVMASAAQDGEAQGLDPMFTANFFKAQIEANKIVQYFLLAEWDRTGAVPDHAPIDLYGTIRPQLDVLQGKLVAELASTTSLRADPDCPATVAKAVHEYVISHPQTASTLVRVAVTRALATVCQR